MTTDEPDEQLDPVSPQDEARVRALLSGARETGPMPADVAARLESTLAGLAVERGGAATEPTPATGSEASIHPLVRTRRHRVVAVLGAAAAVAVLALGVGTFVDREPQAGDDAGGAADTGVVRGEAPRQGDDEADGDAMSVAPDDGAAETNLDGVPWEMMRETEGRPHVVRPGHLTRDLARIQDATFGARGPSAARYGKVLIHAPRGFTCARADWGRGVLVAARYDGDPAYVAFRQPMGATQVVEVLQCGTGELLRSTTLPTRR